MSKLTLPAIDVSVFAPQDLPKHRAQLYSNGRRLYVLAQEVVIQDVNSRTLAYEEPIVAATYTRFQLDRDLDGPTDALVVCLRNTAHIYYPGGNTHLVSLPFTVKSVYAYELGLLLERDPDQNSALVPLAMAPYRFFSLVDPIGDLRAVTTSLTSVIAASESLLFFPRKSTTRSLCVTFNSRLNTVNVYHIKPANRQSKTSTRTKKESAFMTPNPKILDDDLYDAIQPPYPAPIVVSVNMEKKRTSTLLLGISLMARMTSEQVLPDLKLNGALLDQGSLRKDMILTRVDSQKTRGRKLHLTVCSLLYEGTEAIVVSNRAQRRTTVYFYRVSQGLIPTLLNSVQINCLHALALDHDTFPGWLLVLRDEQVLQLVHPYLDVDLPPISLKKFPKISSIASTSGETVALRSCTENRSVFYVSLILEPTNSLVSSCLGIWKYLASSKIYESVYVVWRSSLMLSDTKSEWEALVITILALIYPFNDTSCPSPQDNDVTKLIPLAKEINDHMSLDYSFYDLLPYMFFSLHLLHEESRLDTLRCKDLKKLSFLLSQFVAWMGWPESWTLFYSSDISNLDRIVRILLVVLTEQPPNIFEHFIAIIEGRRSNFTRFSQIVEESEDVDRIFTPRICGLSMILSILASRKLIPSDVVKAMADLDFTLSQVESLPLGLSIPIKNCLLFCQKNPSSEWKESVLELVGRTDLLLLLRSDSHLLEDRPLQQRGNLYGKDSNLIIQSLYSRNDDLLAWDEQSEADRIEITRLIHDKDRRFFEITTLLHQTRIQTATLVADEKTSEYEFTLMKRELAQIVAMRTLTIPLGRAALFYASRKPLLTERFPIPKFNLNTLIAPSMTTINLDESSLNEGICEWGHFHNGVSSGLSISPESKGINGSWVIFNKPAENNPQHAGFLLGLGLNGHLNKLEEWHIYNYLGPKHPLTSVGLLIGMAASLKRSMDNKVTKVLSVHAVALLPQGANDLNVPIIVQMAGLIGIGLLYLETQHRRMSEILLSQFSISDHVDNDDEQEGYKLSAGIALGFINLGKGDDLRGLTDTHVVDRLLGYATSMRDSHSVLDSDHSGSGAIMALAFIYMRTRNRIIANKLRVPASNKLLDYVRPDLLLLRCLAKNLILWDNIEPTRQWMESELPEILRKRLNVTTFKSLDSDQIPIFNILAGAALSIAAKYASSQSIEARNTLLYYLDITLALYSSDTSSFDQKMAFNSACQLQNVLALCVAVVTAGSGDLDVFRRLRVLHGRTDQQTAYGSHIAYSMALGILFLGGSQYGFGDLNFAIASLMVSLYPIFPNKNNDTECHLQVLRHFWALSVELKCLVVRDVKDMSPIKVPVKINYRDGSTTTVMSPTLVPELRLIESLEIRSRSYFDINFDFTADSMYLEKFKKFLTVFVMKKRNHERLKPTVRALLAARRRDIDDNDTELMIKRLVKTTLPELMNGITNFERETYFQESLSAIKEADTGVINSDLSLFNVIDDKIMLDRMASKPRAAEDLWNLRLLFAYADRLSDEHHHYLDADFVETLKQSLWDASQADQEGADIGAE